MLHFLFKTTLFLSPILVLLILPAIVIFSGREYVDVSHVVRVQQSYPDALFSFSYALSPTIKYKYLLVTQKQPTVIALGSSRVMQIRKEFFIEPDKFINAGGASRNLEEALQFILDLSATNTPELIILGIDQDALFLNKDDFPVLDEKNTLERIKDVFALMSRRMYLDYFSQKYSLSELLDESRKTHHVGMSAIVNKDGFRSDGSYQYFQAQHNIHRIENVQAQIKNEAENIRQNTTATTKKQYEVFTKNLQLLERILVIGKEKDIQIIGFSSPYPTDVYSAMSQSPGHYANYVNAGPSAIKEVFNAHDASYFNFSELSSIDGSDKEFVDAIHGTDGLYVKLINQLAKNVPGMQNYVSLENLLKLQKESQDSFVSFQTR